ncbi:MAG: beta-ketoacyl-[acyl-carrier-protein] synthase family protein, partial [Calditrichia bacterium]|nr:beta-ketoacyl-[acyl-carrier-protein] synthase family protein [Calditrichia bacterium]
MKKQRVVITGIGPFTSLGIGKEDFWQNVLEQRKKLKPIPEEFEKNYSFKSKFYIPLPEFNIEDY